MDRSWSERGPEEVVRKKQRTVLGGWTFPMRKYIAGEVY